jgi:hypothetical protein
MKLLIMNVTFCVEVYHINTDKFFAIFALCILLTITDKVVHKKFSLYLLNLKHRIQNTCIVD